MTNADFNALLALVELEVTSLELLSASLDNLVPANWERESDIKELRKLMTAYHEYLTFMLDEVVLVCEAQSDHDRETAVYHRKVFDGYNTLVYDSRKIWHQKYLDLITNL